MDSNLEIPEVYVLKTFVRGVPVPKKDLNGHYHMARLGIVAVKDFNSGVHAKEKMGKFWPRNGGPAEFLHNVSMKSWEAGIIKLGGTERISGYDKKTTSVEQEWVCYVGITPPPLLEGR